MAARFKLLTLVLPVLLVTALIGGCAGSSTAPNTSSVAPGTTASGTQAGTTGTTASATQAGAPGTAATGGGSHCGANGDPTQGLIPVKMRPQQPVSPSFGAFSVRSVSSTAPRALLKLLPPAQLESPSKHPSSFSWSALHRDGAQFNPLLPHSNVAAYPPDPGAVLFSPHFDPTAGLGSAAFCIFDYMLPGYSTGGGSQTLGFNWLLPAIQKADLWVGLANFQKNRWDWFNYPADDVLTLASFLPYEQAGTGRILIALLKVGSEESSLNFTDVGQLEERGIGDMGPAPLGLLTELRSFPIWYLLPDVVDLSPGCAPINDQGGIGSCTAFGNADSAFNYELGQTYGVYGWDFSNPFNRCGPRYMYNQTGVDLGGSCPTGGRTSTDVGTWFLGHGVATEQNAPYGSLSAVSYNCSHSWSAAALADAALLRPETKIFIGTDMGGGDYHWTDADIAIAKNVLKNLKHVIVFRTNLDSNFETTNFAAGNAWTYNGSYIGGHCMCVVGYDTSKAGGVGAFKVRNSWSTSFGDNGYCWISFDSFRSTTAGVYGFYFTEDCNHDVVARFLPGAAPFFWVCRAWIAVLFTDRIVLHWEIPAGALRFDVFRDTMDTPIGTAKSGDSSYEDMTVDDNDAHVYWIEAIDDQGMPSPPSKPIVAWRESPT